MDLFLLESETMVDRAKASACIYRIYTEYIYIYISSHVALMSLAELWIERTDLGLRVRS